MGSGLISSEEGSLPAGYRSATERAGYALWESSRLIRVSGSEGADYLQGQLTNDIEALSPGQGCYAALLDRKGRMRADMRVLRPAEAVGEDRQGAGEIWIELDQLGLGFAFRHLGTYRIGRDADVENLGDQRALVRIEGPSAVRSLGLEIGAGEVAGEAFVTFQVRIVELGGARAHAIATAAGVDLLVDRPELDRVLAKLEGDGIDRIDPAVLEVLRVERGIPRFGFEMGEDTIPQEAGINERAVSFTKGCYIGQETVARLHYKGKPNRHLRGLRFDPGTAVAAGDELRMPGGGDGEPGKVVGRIGTVADSPVQGRIALAILRREAEPGGVVVAGEAGTPAAVIEVPFGGV